MNKNKSVVDSISHIPIVILTLIQSDLKISKVLVKELLKK